MIEKETARKLAFSVLGKLNPILNQDKKHETIKE
jgi:hypothetical protein